MTIPNAHLLHVVMNGRVIGDIQRTGKRQLRLLYVDPAPTSPPLSVSMPCIRKTCARP